MTDHTSHTGHIRAEHVGEEPHHGVGHVVSPKILIATAFALLVLTFITVAASKVSFDTIEMPELNIIVALGIALVKATLVCLFFMHLKWDRPFNAFVIVGSLGFVVLFITFALTDTYQYRGEVLTDESSVIQGELAKLPPPLPKQVIDDHASNPPAEPSEH